MDKNSDKVLPSLEQLLKSVYPVVVDHLQEIEIDQLTLVLECFESIEMMREDEYRYVYVNHKLLNFKF